MGQSSKQQESDCLKPRSETEARIVKLKRFHDELIHQNTFSFAEGENQMFISATVDHTECEDKRLVDDSEEKVLNILEK